MRRVHLLAISLAAMMAVAVPASAGAKGATQVSGIGFPDVGGECDELPFDYAIVMTGDLEGCVYGLVNIDEFTKGPGPSGVYKERADETFVGSYNGMTGTFRMTENFHGKFDLDSGHEIFGFCKHPIVKGSGTDDFAGVSGRLDFKDEVDDPTDVFFPYKGHLQNLD
jgi:hypothetical protein